MALPKSSTATYTITLPSTQEQIKARPFNMRQEKALMMAMQSEKVDVMIDTLSEVIVDCTSLDSVKGLPHFDVEYLFIQLRCISVGETANLRIRCECPDEKEEFVNVTVDLSQLEVNFDEAHEPKFWLNDEMGVEVRYPTFDTISMLSQIQGEEDSETLAAVLKNTIINVFDQESVYPMENETTQEVVDWVESLTRNEVIKIRNFFDNAPQIQKTIKYKCKCTGEEKELTLRGIQSFFS